MKVKMPVYPTHPVYRVPELRANERKNDMDPMFQFFNYAHLREDLKPVSKQFADVAQWIIDNLPRNPERTVALRKLLEAKDAGVRAAIYKNETD